MHDGFARQGDGEVGVGLGTPVPGDGIAARNRFLVEILVAEAVWNKRLQIDPADLETAWLSEPPGMVSIEAGDDWIEGGKSALLMVPSVIIPEEFNVLINPAHPDAKKIRAAVARQFVYDPRLG